MELRRPVYVDDTYYFCTEWPGDVYSTARFGRVSAATDADYLAWLSADGPVAPERVPATFATVAELRDHVTNTIPGATLDAKKFAVAVVAAFKSAKTALGASLPPTWANDAIQQVDQLMAKVPD